MTITTVPADDGETTLAAVSNQRAQADLCANTQRLSADGLACNARP